MNAHVSPPDLIMVPGESGDRARAAIIANAVLLFDIGGMPAVMELFQVATAEIGRRRRAELTKAGWIV